MKKGATNKNDINISDLIKNVGGAKAIQKFLTSKDHNINIESIYKWKKNGIPHRYKTLIYDLQNQQSKESKISSDASKIIKTEIISKNRNIKKIIIPAITFSIFLLLITYLQYENKNRIETLYIKTSKLENNIKNIQNDYQQKINKISNEIELQTSTNEFNKKTIQEIYENYSNYESMINKNETNAILHNGNEIEKFENTLNDKEAILYLFWLKDNINKHLDYDKLNYFIDHMKIYTLPNNIKINLNFLTELKSIRIPTIIKLMEDIKNILDDKKNSSNSVESSETYNIVNKLKKLIKITKIDVRNNIVLIENINKSLINQKFDQVLYLISEAKINPSEEINNWILDVERLNNTHKAINNILNWMIYKG